MKPDGDDHLLCMNMQRQGARGMVLRVFIYPAWQVRISEDKLAFSLKSWENQPLLQCPDVMAKAPKGSGRNMIKTARATHACSVFHEAPHSRCLSPCRSCSAVPAPAMAPPHWAGTCHLSYVSLAVEESEMGRPYWVCSNYCSFSNTAEALQQLPAACLSLCSLITALTGILILSK